MDAPLDQPIRGRHFPTTPEPSGNQEGQKATKKDVGYIKKAVVFSLGGSQIVGGVAAVTVSVKGVWNLMKASFTTGKMGVHGVELLGRKAISSLSPKQKIEQAEKIRAVEQLLSFDSDNLVNSALKAKDNGIRFVASILSMVPLVGVLGSGLVLAAFRETAKSEGPTFVQRGAEAFSKNVIAAVPKVATWQIRENSLYPLSGKTYQQFMNECSESAKQHDSSLSINYSYEATVLKPSLEKLGAQLRRIKVDRGDGKEHTIRCDVINTNNNPAAKTMVLFHGNGMIGPQMDKEAEFYKSQGWNVVMMTYGGYPGSDEKVTTTETTTIQDVHAVLKRLESEGVTNIGVHGHSMGTSLAMHATQLSDNIRYVALSKGYDSAKNVCANTTKNLRERTPIFKLLPSALVRGLAAKAMPEGRVVPGVKDKNGKSYHTDGCNNMAKVKEYSGVLVTVGGNKDHLMGRNKYMRTGEFEDNFSKDLFDAHVEAKPNSPHFTKLTDEGHVPGVRLCEDVLQEALLAHEELKPW